MWISVASDAGRAVSDPSSGGKIFSMKNSASWTDGGHDEAFFFSLALVFGGLQALWLFAGFSVTFSDFELFSAECA